MNEMTLDIIYTVCEYFLVFSFLGWCVEVVFQAVTKGLVINRGFLNGPVCPIYGFGVIAVFFMLQMIGGSNIEEQNTLSIFVFGVVLSTGVELLGGWILDKAFHARWWDYSSRPFNFHGYICLEFSLIWGLAILIVVRDIYPMLSRTLSHIPHRAGWILIAVFGTVYIADLIVSVSIMIGLNKRMAELDEMQRRMRIVSNSLSEHIGENALETAKRVDEARVQAALARSEVREQIDTAREETRARAYRAASGYREMKSEAEQELDRRRSELRERIRKSRHFGMGRLLRAFPDMRHRDYAEIMDELRKEISSLE